MQIEQLRRVKNVELNLNQFTCRTGLTIVSYIRYQVDRSEFWKK